MTIMLTALFFSSVLVLLWTALLLSIFAAIEVWSWIAKPKGWKP
jgi:hypothetical protein